MDELSQKLREDYQKRLKIDEIAQDEELVFEEVDGQVVKRIQKKELPAVITYEMIQDNKRRIRIDTERQEKEALID